jgi:hypothetical protein
MTVPDTHDDREWHWVTVSTFSDIGGPAEDSLELMEADLRDPRFNLLVRADDADCQGTFDFGWVERDATDADGTRTLELHARFSLRTASKERATAVIEKALHAYDFAFDRVVSVSAESEVEPTNTHRTVVLTVIVD